MRTTRPVKTRGVVRPLAPVVMALVAVIILALGIPIVRNGRRTAVSQPRHGRSAAAARAADETWYPGALERESSRAASFAVPAWSPDGRLLAAGGDHLLVLRDSARRAAVRTCSDPSARIYTLAWN